MPHGINYGRRISFTLFIGALVAAPFYIPGPNGKPLATLDDILPDANTFSSLLSQGKQITKKLETYIPGDTNASQQKTVNGWQDANGVWHFSDTKPADDPNVKTRKIHIDTSRITPLPDMPEPVKKKHNAEKKDEEVLPNRSNPSEIIKEAQKARDQMNERHSNQKKILDSL